MKIYAAILFVLVVTVGCAKQPGEGVATDAESATPPAVSQNDGQVKGESGPAPPTPDPKAEKIARLKDEYLKASQEVDRLESEKASLLAEGNALKSEIDQIKLTIEKAIENEPPAADGIDAHAERIAERFKTEMAKIRSNDDRLGQIAARIKEVESLLNVANEEKFQLMIVIAKLED